jgi:fatty-acyl-CoA synthase
MQELISRLDEAADRGRDVVVLARTGLATASWRDVAAEARSVAARLKRLGAAGGHVAVFGGPSIEMLSLIQGVWRAGATLTHLPPPGRGWTLDGWLKRLRISLAASPPDLLVVAPPFEQVAEGLHGLATRVVTGYQLMHLGRNHVAAEEVYRSTRPAIVQLTSGSTDTARAVQISEANLISNLDDIYTVTEHDEAHDVLISWLPLYHDMGLIGLCVLPMITGCRLVLADPSSFTSRPSSWWETVSRWSGTTTAAPSFAYSLAARSLKAARGLDLSSCRFSLCGGELVDAAAIELFLSAAAPRGLSRGAVVPAYGMAEATLAISISPMRRGLRTAPCGPAPTSRMRPLLGPPLPSLQVTVLHEEGNQGGHEVGELAVKGASVTQGYTAAAANAAAFTEDGWLRTGDLGRVIDGEVQVVGRKKEIIIGGGENLNPADIEEAATAVPGVRPGCVVAFPIQGRLGSEAVGIAFEQSSDVLSTDLEQEVKQAVLGGVGVLPGQVVAVPLGAIPKTPSGKPQRLYAAKLFERKG